MEKGDNMEISSFIPQDYTSLFGERTLRMQVPKHCIEAAFKKILGEQATLLGGNIVEFQNEKYHYKVTQKTENSTKPWYSYSGSRLNELKKLGIKEIYVLFFDDTIKKSVYDVYFQCFKIDEIKNSWSKQSNSDIYRYNPDNYTETMDHTDKGVRK
jgi:hypothetical protein